MKNDQENLYFVVKPAEHTRSLYYVGNEDGLWPAKLVPGERGGWVPEKTSSIMIPYSWLMFNITFVKPSGLKNDLQPVEDAIPKDFQELLDD